MAEVETTIQNAADMDHNVFLPAPNTWEKIRKLPPHIRKFWIESPLKELKDLLRKRSFIHETPNDDDPIIPVTANFRVNCRKAEVTIRITWRSHARKCVRANHMVSCRRFRAFKLFLAAATVDKKRLYQLDNVAAFLQSDVMGTKFTILPSEWKELFKDYPEVQESIGTPKRVGKSLYGDTAANLAWDTTRSAWLSREEIGFERLVSDGSTCRRSTKEGLILLLNAIDDQLYFTTSDSLRKWLERQHRTDLMFCLDSHIGTCKRE